VLDGDLVVGTGGAKGPPDASGEIEIGYGVAPSFRNCGIGTAGAELVVRDAFERGVKRVLATTRPDNLPSWRLLERLGFQRDGEMRREPDGLLWRWIITSAPGAQLERRAPAP
jgi:RimJ/RimL family protein N-acetyltransferase